MTTKTDVQMYQIKVKIRRHPRYLQENFVLVEIDYISPPKCNSWFKRSIFFKAPPNWQFSSVQNELFALCHGQMCVELNNEQNKNFLWKAWRHFQVNENLPVEILLRGEFFGDEVS